MQMQPTQMTSQTTDGAATQTTNNNADNYTTTQTTFINNIADYNADADKADNFADNRQQCRRQMT
jgi:hypothetical protein